MNQIKNQLFYDLGDKLADKIKPDFKLRKKFSVVIENEIYVIRECLAENLQKEFE